MSAAGYETPHDRNVKGLHALAEALGPVGMVRFLQHYEQGQGDYTAQRKLLLKDASMDDICKQVPEGPTSS